MSAGPRRIPVTRTLRALGILGDLGISEPELGRQLKALRARLAYQVDDENARVRKIRQQNRYLRMKIVAPFRLAAILEDYLEHVRTLPDPPRSLLCTSCGNPGALDPATQEFRHDHLMDARYCALRGRRREARRGAVEVVW